MAVVLVNDITDRAVVLLMTSQIGQWSWLIASHTGQWSWIITDRTEIL